MLRRDPKPVKRRKKEKAAVVESLPDTPEERDLFDALRRLRTELARAQDVPPYVIFHDSTLLAMVRQRPASRDDFAQIPGVGAAKLERYAEDFLDAIRQAEEAT
ncbi:MAG TPA: HRDC domain-containing protein, partial [Rhodothermales bacterium]|nr:HRDC domain-containing protein [Rhodothermales bacterium]